MVKKYEEWKDHWTAENSLPAQEIDKDRFNLPALRNEIEKNRQKAEKLPGMSKNLILETKTWEEDKGIEFLYDGVRILSEIEEYMSTAATREEIWRQERVTNKLGGVLNGVDGGYSGFGKRPYSDRFVFGLSHWHILPDLIEERRELILEDVQNRRRKKSPNHKNNCSCDGGGVDRCPVYHENFKALEKALDKSKSLWDMKDCPIPEGYDARLFRPSLEAAFKSVGYSGPVSITAYGDQTQTPDHILRVLSSTGVAVAHTRPESTNSVMYSDMVEWRGQNPAPASMMIISNQVHTVFAWDLARLQQRTLYNLFLVYSIEYRFMTILKTCREWFWERLLGYADDETRSAPLVQEKCSDTGELSSARIYCKSCNFDSQNPENFRKHLSSYKHKREEAIDPTETVVDCVTEEWARDYPATPEYATAQIAVWWDLFQCPTPKGYDARRVRPSLEAAFKNLGYSGPVSITAFGDLNRIPDHLLRGLSSTGVNVVHTCYG
ncbi:PREDICTED: uncharacterized protein LOC104729045 [Camelina sativa]|uniref:Uncharacterized protein LOC104729045 n=1 Tax=Camelina sativa TaxID=90675 RepID=A0ABM1QLP7_CAMSA|nr:PREDICTED: uncharacterized protein LOC104729045 [Camelina sativa]